ncbi:keratin, type II cytoskeletal 2 epidermal-like isoform X2 [Prinia subflava]|uniref:keratin, type II cytoskeletal 2 epidermal-like isoform X2 n=1 Tax=Prinia subflava TaxID=208062 RepID=UPI002FE0E21D
MGWELPPDRGRRDGTRGQGQASAAGGASSGEDEGMSPRNPSAGREKLEGLWAGKAARESRAGGAGRGGRAERALRGAEEGGGRKPGEKEPGGSAAGSASGERDEPPRRLRRCRCPGEGSGRLHWEGTLGFRTASPRTSRTRLGRGFILPRAKLQGTKLPSLR